MDRDRTPENASVGYREPLRLRAWGLSATNAVYLMPLFFAALWFGTDFFYERVTWWGSTLSFLMAGIGGWGALRVFTPVELTADHIGIQHRHLWTRRSISWNEIESIGVAKSKSDPLADPATLLLFGGSRSRAGTRLIGINLRTAGRDVAYRRSFTGYETHFANVFSIGTQKIVEELQERLEAARRR